MIFVISIYDPVSGLIKRHAEGPSPDILMENVSPDEGWIAGYYDAAQVFVHDGVPEPLPPRPGPWAVWNGQEWTDPRTPADHAAAIAAARSSAQRDRTALLMDLRAMRILTTAEAIEAARGDIPASFADAMASLPQEAQDMARIKWAGDQVISRTNPLILMAAYAKGISDEQLDAAFGVQIPE